MDKEARTAWLKGFAAGETEKYGCPYRPGTVEAKAWEAGWDQGDLKRNGMPCRDRPLASDVNEPPLPNS
jgi:hypothetical protein